MPEPEQPQTPNPVPPAQNGNTNPALRILGQEFFYPTAWTGAVTLCFFSICVCIALAIVYVFAHDRGYTHIETLFKPQLLQPSGPPTEVPTAGRFEFWAPSEDTYKDEQPPANYEWQKGVPATRISQFEVGLDTFATGWRRVDVIGKGTSGTKSGHWYSLTTKPDFKEADFVNYYRTFWQSKSAIFMEHVQTKSEYKKP